MVRGWGGRWVMFLVGFGGLVVFYLVIWFLILRICSRYFFFKLGVILEIKFIRFWL